MKELRRCSLIILRKSVLACRKAELAFFCFFFLSGFFFTNIMIHRAAGEAGGYFFNSSPPLPPALQTIRHSQVIAAESSPLRIAGSRTQTRSLWFPIGSR